MADKAKITKKTASKKAKTIKSKPKEINVFDEHGTEKNALFEAMIKRNGLWSSWPRTFRTGALVKDKKLI